MKHFPHEPFYANNKSIINVIIDFSKEQEVQLIVALPAQYSFLYSLTHKSITEAIYKNSKVPVLILK